MGKPLSKCPYCDGEHFNGFERADAPDLPEDKNDVEALEKAFTKHKENYGHWFNQCADCGGWSVYKNGLNYPIEKKDKKPKKYSLPPIAEEE